MKPLTRFQSLIWIAGCIFFSIGGLVAFILLFIPDFNVYWLILSPIILALYQAPAVLLYYLYKKRKRKLKDETSPEDT